MVKVGKLKVYFKNGTIIEKEIECGESQEEQVKCANGIVKIMNVVKENFTDNGNAYFEIAGFYVKLSEVIALDFQLYDTEV